MEKIIQLLPINKIYYLHLHLNNINLKNMEKKELMTIKEVLEYFSISQKTLYNWSNEGKINSLRVGRRVYYKRLEVENLAK